MIRSTSLRLVEAGKSVPSRQLLLLRCCVRMCKKRISAYNFVSCKWTTRCPTFAFVFVPVYVLLMWIFGLQLCRTWSRGSCCSSCSRSGSPWRACRACCSASTRPWRTIRAPWRPPSSTRSVVRQTPALVCRACQSLAAASRALGTSEAKSSVLSCERNSHMIHLESSSCSSFAKPENFTDFVVTLLPFEQMGNEIFRGKIKTNNLSVGATVLKGGFKVYWMYASRFGRAECSGIGL